MTRNKKKPGLLHNIFLTVNLSVVAIALALHYGGVTWRASVAEPQGNVTKVSGSKKSASKAASSQPQCHEGQSWCETIETCLDDELWEVLCPGQKCGEGRFCQPGTHCSTLRPYHTPEGKALGVCLEK